VFYFRIQIRVQQMVIVACLAGGIRRAPGRQALQLTGDMVSNPPLEDFIG
jgi:hypothetical protein